MKLHHLLRVMMMAVVLMLMPVWLFLRPRRQRCAE